MRNRPAKHIAIIFILLSFFFLLTFANIVTNRSKEKVPAPPKTPARQLHKTSLKDVISLDWNKNLLDIAAVYPNGEMDRKSPEEKSLSCYKIDVNLTDLDESVRLAFYQNEDFITGNSQKNVSLRKITFTARSPGEQKQKFDSISDVIQSFKPVIPPDQDQASYDAAYMIMDPDLSGGTMIILNMKENVSNPVHVTISRLSRK